MKPYQSKVYRTSIKTVFRAIVLGGSSYLGQAFADEIPDIASHRFDHWPRASDSELDKLRGGFVLPNGMTIDFNLERITTLNGSVVFSSFFQLPDNASLLQNGTLNQSPDLAGSGFSSVIQNNVDNQTIRTVTAINIAVSNLKNLDLTNGSLAFNNLIQPNAH